MRIALITSNPFPIGNVSTNRFTTYCKSIAEKGLFVKIFILHPSKSEEAKCNAPSGSYKNILYQNMANYTYWSYKTNILKKTITLIKGLFHSIKVLRNDQIDTIIIVQDNFIIYIFYWLFSIIYSGKLIIEKNEYPFGYLNYSKIKKYFQNIKYSFFDGFIIMTEELVDYYSKVKASDAKIFLLPMSVDSDRFENIRKNLLTENYIGCTFGYHNRDGLKDTLKAYKLYKHIIGDTSYKLWMVGDFKNLLNRIEIQEYIAANDLKDDAIIKGSYRSDRVPQILKDAKCLITTPQKYTSGGFPTKLGEYLATGNPVISTNCGEIGNFLINRKNCFLSEPSNINSIADDLVFIHNNQIDAEIIGLEGLKLAKTSFNTDKYIDSLILFLQSENIE
ncbi:MAG: glycosyltransferase [Flavobacterium sp.]|nr:glycosyltransferase [Flavobacterium sp.]